jgi:hypothetical protein
MQKWVSLQRIREFFFLTHGSFDISFLPLFNANDDDGRGRRGDPRAATTAFDDGKVSQTAHYKVFFYLRAVKLMYQWQDRK